MRPAAIAFALLLASISATADVRLSPADGTNHSYPAVCRQPEGFVAAWESDGADGRQVTVQRLDDDGRAFGAAFVANQENAGDQQFPDVACRSDGSFFVVWESQGQDGDGLGIFARDFAADGTARGDEFQVNTHPADNQRLPRVCLGTDGGGVVVWESFGQAAEHPRVFGQRLDAAGSPSGTEFATAEVAEDVQADPAVACGENGAFMVAWATRRTDPGSQILATLFDAAGSPVNGAAIPNAPDAVQRRHPAIAHLSEGVFALAFEAGGAVQLGTIEIDQEFSDVSLAELSTLTPHSSLLGRGRQPESSRNEAPTVAGDGGSEIFVAWSSGSVADFSLEGARPRFPADTRTFFASSTHRGSHGANSPLGRGIDITTAPDGDLIIWQKRDIFADDSSSAIYSRRFRDCIGDCSDSGAVSINELIRGVRIALELEVVDACGRLDANQSGAVEISELIRAVSEALAGICPAPVN